MWRHVEAGTHKGVSTRADGGTRTARGGARMREHTQVAIEGVRRRRNGKSVRRACLAVIAARFGVGTDAISSHAMGESYARRDSLAQGRRGDQDPGSPVSRCSSQIDSRSPFAPRSEIIMPSYYVVCAHGRPFDVSNAAKLVIQRTHPQPKSGFPCLHVFDCPDGPSAPEHHR